METESGYIRDFHFHFKLNKNMLTDNPENPANPENPGSDNGQVASQGMPLDYPLCDTVPTKLTWNHQT